MRYEKLIIYYCIAGGTASGFYTVEDPVSSCGYICVIQRTRSCIIISFFNLRSIQPDYLGFSRRLKFCWSQ